MTQTARLLEHHRQHLRESGLTDETIGSAGIYSEYDRNRLATILNRKKLPRGIGSAIVFPFIDDSGAVAFQRIRPDNPPFNGDGKPRKYLQPSGVPTRPYVPPTVWERLQHPDQELVITEGEKKALACTQELTPAIGLCGVENWHGKNSLSLCVDLERIEWRDRPVFICFDSDAAENASVRMAETLLADALKRRGAKVRVVRLPSALDGGKQGLDDFLVARGKGELRKLMDEAEEPEPPTVGEAKRPATEMDPGTTATRYIDRSKADGFPRLRYHRDEFYIHNGAKFRPVRDSEVRAAVTQFLHADYIRVGQGNVSNVIEHLRAQTIISGEIEPAHWLDDVPGSEWPSHETIVAKNGVFHLPSLFAGKPYRVPATPALFNTTALDFDFPDGDTCEPPRRWLDFLNALWPDDADEIEALQRWFGYVLTSDTRQQKMLAIFGPRRSGKGTIARVQSALVGRGNVASPTLSSFTGSFGLAPLLGKSLAIIADARISGRADQQVAIERLLSITGEDLQTVDRKHRPPVTCQLPTRLMLLSNELPRLVDSSGALIGRMIVLQLSESFYGRENVMLSDELLKELPGIAWWAVDGWRKLQQDGRLLQPASSVELTEEWEELSSPHKTFVEQECITGPEHEVSRSELYDAYRRWCEDRGTRSVEDESVFGRNLRAVVPRLRHRQPRQEGKRVRFYVGLDLRR